MKKITTAILAIALSFGIFAQQNDSIAMIGCNFNTPRWGESLGVVNFKTEQTWKVGTQEWSDVVVATNCLYWNDDLPWMHILCDTSHILTGVMSDDDAACWKNIEGYGSLFSWCAVIRFQEQLCPNGWRVPTKKDFIYLDKILGGIGESRMDSIFIHNTYLNPAVWGGSLGGFITQRRGHIGQGLVASYWSQSKKTEKCSFSDRHIYYYLELDSRGKVNPQSSSVALVGMMLRCVRSIDESVTMIDTFPEDYIFVVVEVSPEFPGGIEAKMRFIQSNTRFRHGQGVPQGTVFVTFVVERDGSLTNVRVLRGIDPFPEIGADAQAIRLVESMPNWTPGKIGGKAVRTQFVMPIRFIRYGWVDSWRPEPAKHKAHQPTVTVTGLVTHEDAHLPASSVRVWWEHGTSAFTDSIGNYSIQISPSTRRISFVPNIIGFERYVVNIPEGIKNDTIVNVTLPRAVTTLYPLIVKAHMGRDLIPTISPPRTRRDQPDTLYRIVPKLLNTEKQWLLSEYTPLSFWTNVISEQISYPEIALNAGIQGTVHARFDIDVNGDLVNLEILRGIGGGADQEVLRVLNLAPNWSQYSALHGVRFSEQVASRGLITYFGSFILPVRFQIEHVTRNEQLIRDIEERITKIDSSFRHCQLCFVSVSRRDTFDYALGRAGAFRFDRTKRDDPNNIRFVYSIIFYYDTTTIPNVKIERGYLERIWYCQNNTRIAIRKEYSKRKWEIDSTAIRNLRAAGILERGNVMLHINNGEVIRYEKTGEIDVVIFVENGVVSLIRRGEREDKEVREMQRYSPFVSMSELRPPRPERRPALRSAFAQATIWGQMGTHREQSERYHYNFSFNFLAGRIGGLTGVEISGLVGNIRQNMNGVQISGIYGHVERDVNGVQIGGIGSRAKHGNMNGVQIGGVYSDVGTGTSGNVNGLQISGIYSAATAHVNGLQIAGIFSAAALGRVRGMQISGIYGAVRSSMEGIQLAGLVNNTEGDVRGVQIAGLGNFANGHPFGNNVIGMQIAGLGNRAGNIIGLQVVGLGNFADRVRGLQIAGLANFSEKISTGIQIAGLYNHSRSVNGVQISGIMNRSTSLRGLQIGLISVNDTIESGGSLSLVNIVRRGFYRGFEISVADYSNVAVTYRMGTRTLYTIYTVGANFIEDNLLNFGIGFGHRRAISNNIDFRPELVFYNYFPMDFRDIQPTFSTRLRLGFIYNISENLGLSLTPSVFVMNSRLNNGNTEHYSISPIPSFHNLHESENRLTTLGIGVSLGINF